MNTGGIHSGHWFSLIKIELATSNVNKCFPVKMNAIADTRVGSLWCLTGGQMVQCNTYRYKTASVSILFFATLKKSYFEELI